MSDFPFFMKMILTNSILLPYFGEYKNKNNKKQ